jgi:hypothetical protein
MAPLFPYLVVRHAVADVPTTVVDGRPAVVGPLSEDAYAAAVLANA